MELKELIEGLEGHKALWIKETDSLFCEAVFVSMSVLSTKLNYTKTWCSMCTEHTMHLLDFSVKAQKSVDEQTGRNYIISYSPDILLPEAIERLRREQLQNRELHQVYVGTFERAGFFFT